MLALKRRLKWDGRSGQPSIAEGEIVAGLEVVDEVMLDGVDSFALESWREFVRLDAGEVE